MYSGIHSIMPLEDFPRPNLVGDPCLVLTTDPKPRLRWTAEFHERFVDAVTQLGGPDKATPKMIMRTMGVKGLTLYHLKSHLQKYRMGKQSCKEFSDNSKEGIILTSNHLELTIPMTSQDMGSSTSSSTRMMPQDLNDGFEVIEALRVQMEIQRILHEQLENDYACGNLMKEANKKLLADKICKNLNISSFIKAESETMDLQKLLDLNTFTENYVNKLSAQ
ncbi:putative transcription factor MYB-HB-like family [Helianthus annuus]|nr:putative transcription factor MYB-HB-like family [Helianthus annuus]